MPQHKKFQPDRKVPPAAPVMQQVKQAVPPVEEAGKSPEVLEKLAGLEMLLRGVGRDSMTMMREQQDMQAFLQTLLLRLSDLELSTKALSQTTWKAMQENQGFIQHAEQHFAGALRDLEARVREEMQLQLRRSLVQALLPALDDLDLVIANQRRLMAPAGEQNSLLEAVVLVRQKLADGLGALGLEEIPIEEQVTRFDPSLHEPVESDIPAEWLGGDDLSSGTIIRVRRAGYRFNGRVLRVPQVLVKS